MVTKATAVSKRLVWGASVYWNSVFQVGAKHLARMFAEQGWQVAFLGHPLIPSNFLRVGNFRENLEQLSVWLAGGKRAPTHALYYYAPLAVLPVRKRAFFSTKKWLAHWHRFTFPDLGRTLTRNGFKEVDALVLDSPLQACLLDIVQARRVIVRVVDNLAGFEQVSFAMLEKEREMVSRADCVVYTAKSLEKEVRRLGARKLCYIPNGVSVEQFMQKRPPLPSALASIKKPRVVYVGALEYWFDFETLKHCAENMPEVSFVLIGPDKLARERLPKRPNICLLGEQPYHLIPAFLHHANAGIIPFNTAKYPTLVNNINPLKLYEYLACGLPVAASAWEELRLLQSPAVLCDSAHDFIEALRSMLSRTVDKQALQDYARAHDWNKAFESFADLI